MGCCASQPRIPEIYLRPQTLNPSGKVDFRKLRKLILDSKLAPCYPGGEDCHLSIGASPAAPAEECPICFLFFPVLNTSKCCSKRVCTECFLQVQTSAATGNPTLCPWCKSMHYTARLVGVRTDADRALDTVEEQKVMEARVREREAEILRDQERGFQRIEQERAAQVAGQEAAAAAALGGPPQRRPAPLNSASISNGTPGQWSPSSSSRSRSVASSTSAAQAPASASPRHGPHASRQARAADSSNGPAAHGIPLAGVRRGGAGGHAPPDNGGGGGGSGHAQQRSHRAQSTPTGGLPQQGLEGGDYPVPRRLRSGGGSGRYKLTDFIPYAVADMSVSVEDMNDFMLEQAMYESIAAAHRARLAAAALRPTGAEDPSSTGIAPLDGGAAPHGEPPQPRAASGETHESGGLGTSSGDPLSPAATLPAEGSGGTGRTAGDGGETTARAGDEIKATAGRALLPHLGSRSTARSTSLARAGEVGDSAGDVVAPEDVLPVVPPVVPPAASAPSASEVEPPLAGAAAGAPPLPPQPEAAAVGREDPQAAAHGQPLGS